MDALLDRFRQHFGTSATVSCRSPGRINLIGEHTDYSHLPVLPMAIDRGMLFAGAASDDGVVSARSLQFEPDARLVRGELDRDTAATASWQRYLHGVLLELSQLAPGAGARLLVAGDLPPTGGLSSSSALSVGLCATLDALWGLGLSRQRMVELAVVAERHVGVESGGMDQTVIAHARAGHALRIDFGPTRLQPVTLPAQLSIVVAYSGQEAPKGGSVRQAYNERVVGCRMAAALLARQSGQDAAAVRVLGQLAHTVDPDQLQALPERCSPRQAAERSGAPLEQLVQLTATRFDAAAQVPVRPYARHVLGEARRVELAQQALGRGALERFGELLNQSHHSLARDFTCSTAALDRLCGAMRAAGALGARLTGAGFGGYAIAAVTPDALEAVVQAAGAVCPGPVFTSPAADGLTVQRL